MAEAIELDLTLNQPGSQPSKHPLNPILTAIQDTDNSDIPEQYNIEEFYKDDQLGSDVLKNKYLAPWENHPWELWKRQAIAIASVEKTKALRNKWEKTFFSILENFKFVPGGRIMHGAGRKDITTTLNNCYVVAVKDDSVKSIYDLSLIHISEPTRPY